MAKIEHLFINFKMKNKNANFASFYNTLAKEIFTVQQNHDLQIATIYVATTDGLVLTDQQLITILNLLEQFTSQNLREYTFEIGYQVLLPKQLAIFKQFAVNRLVCRVRTFSNELLRNYNNNFNSLEMMDLIATIKALNYDNFSIDLENNIFGQTKVDILNDLNFALAVKAPHISYQSCNEEYNQKHQEIIRNFLALHHYDNYECFSFALTKNYFSQQTLAYLRLKNWYGLGPEAASFLKLAIGTLIITNNAAIPWNNEITTLRLREYYQLIVTQGLMIRKGFSFSEFELVNQSLRHQIIKLIDTGYLQWENDFLRTTNHGWNLLNQVLTNITKTIGK